MERGDRRERRGEIEESGYGRQKRVESGDRRERSAETEESGERRQKGAET